MLNRSKDYSSFFFENRDHELISCGRVRRPKLNGRISSSLVFPVRIRCLLPFRIHENVNHKHPYPPPPTHTPLYCALVNIFIESTPRLLNRLQHKLGHIKNHMMPPNFKEIKMCLFLYEIDPSFSQLHD